jgi:hypothetical protein
MPSISKNRFEELHHKIISTFKKECLAKGILPKTKPDYQLYGYSSTKWDEKQPSIYKSMSEHEGLKAVLEGNAFNGRYLRDKKADFDKGRAIDINDFYLKLYCAYIGELDKIDYYKNSDFTTLNFTGLYYDYTRHEVKDFYLSITIEDDEPIRYESAYQEGFHHESDQYISSENSIHHVGDMLYLNLRKEDAEYADEMHFIIKVFSRNPNNWKYLTGVVSTIAANHQYPIATRVMLIEENHYQSNEAETKVAIERYLMLKRNSIRAHPREITTLRQLEDRRINVNKIEPMIGTWRTIHYAKDGKTLIQDKMVIDQNSKIALYTKDMDPDVAHQIGVCSMSDGKLCIATHPEIGTRVLSYMIVKIPNRISRQDERNVVTAVSGVLASLVDNTSAEDNVNPYAAIVLLVKEENKEFLPEIINERRFREMLEFDADLAILKNKLDNIKQYDT